MTAPPARLNPDQRRVLIGALMQQRDGLDRDQASGSAREALFQGKAQTAEFTDLPGYAAIRMQQEFAADLGIANPFYRTHSFSPGTIPQCEGIERVNFSSYDYLGLNGHPRIVAAVAEAAERWGTSVSASRLTSGERPFHAAFEAELASLYGAEAALTFVSGHATNVAVVGSIVEPGDLVVHDALAHNSIVMGAEVSRAHRRSFAHNDLDVLDELLRRDRARYKRCLIVTEGLFSMDGDGPDLGRLIEIKRRHGAWLMIDDAHALGVLGRTGRGLAEHATVDPAEVDIWTGTLSKTLVSCGGYVAGPATLIEFLKFRAPGMVYSVGISPPAIAAASTALDLMLREPDRVATLRTNGRRFLELVCAHGLDCGSSQGAAIAPVVIGDSLRTVLLAERLTERGFVSVPVIPPGVPEAQARLRFFLTATHSLAQIEAAIAALADEHEKLGTSGVSLVRAADGVTARWQGRGGSSPA